VGFQPISDQVLRPTAIADTFFSLKLIPKPVRVADVSSVFLRWLLPSVLNESSLVYPTFATVAIRLGPGARETSMLISARSLRPLIPRILWRLAPTGVPAMTLDRGCGIDSGDARDAFPVASDGLMTPTITARMVASSIKSRMAGYDQCGRGR